jgi:hypothetical protein
MTGAMWRVAVGGHTFALTEPVDIHAGTVSVPAKESEAL